MEFGLAIAGIYLLLSIGATTKVIRCELNERSQKIGQLLVVWLIPILGALFVYFTLRSMDKSLTSSENRPFGGGPRDTMSGSEGPSD